MNIEADTAQLIPVLVTKLTRRGNGMPADPIRIITQIWHPNGELLAEVDPTQPEQRALEEIITKLVDLWPQFDRARFLRPAEIASEINQLLARLKHLETEARKPQPANA